MRLAKNERGFSVRGTMPAVAMLVLAAAALGYHVIGRRPFLVVETKAR